MLSRTIKNGPINRGQILQNSQIELLSPIWQGLQDDYQTYCGIVCFSKGKKDV